MAASDLFSFEQDGILFLLQDSERLLTDTCSDVSSAVWNENFGSALSIKDSAVAAPTVADNSALTEDHTHQLTVSADAEAPVTIDAPKLPPAAVFLELLGVSQEQWKAAGGDMNITDLMAEKMSLLEKYKLPTERRQRLVMGTQHNRNLFIR